MSNPSLSTGLIVAVSTAWFMVQLVAVLAVTGAASSALVLGVLRVVDGLTDRRAR